VAAGRNLVHPKGDDLFLQAHQHAVERLMRGVADLHVEVLQVGNTAELGEQQVDRFRRARDEQVDTFRAEQDGAAQPPLPAEREQSAPHRPEILERNEFVSRDVDDAVHPLAKAEE
jgi:hypothetical protein